MKQHIRVLKLLPGYVVGQEIAVECDDDGTPFEDYWFRRLKDAKLDGCCELVKPEPEPPLETVEQKPS